MVRSRRLRAAFAHAHEQRYGYRDDAARGRARQPARVRVGPRTRAASGGARPRSSPRRTGAASSCSPARRARRVSSAASPRPATRAARPGALRAARGDAAGAARLVGRRRRARHDPPAATRARRAERCSTRSSCRSLTGALRAACEEMGVVLIRSAHSSNIKERRDASTALFDADGADGHAGRAHPRAPRRDAGGGRRRCSASATRRASRGSSTTRSRRHPPARHHRRSRPCSPAPARLLGFAASRAHHADVGGPRARLDAGRQPHARGGGRRDLAAPARRRGARGDRRAHAPARGAPRRPARAARGQPHRRAAARRARGAGSGADRLREATDAVLDYSERRTRACLAALPDGEREAEDVLEAAEGDLVLRLRARRARASGSSLDFAGSAPQHAGNLNCPLAVTRSACLFAVRVLTDPDIPPTAGAYRPIEVLAPRGQPAQRPPRRGRRGGQRRDLLARRRPRARAPSAAPRARGR